MILAGGLTITLLPLLLDNWPAKSYIGMCFQVAALFASQGGLNGASQSEVALAGLAARATQVAGEVVTATSCD